MFPWNFQANFHKFLSLHNRDNPCRCGHYILPLWFLLSFFLLIFCLADSQRSQSGCLPYFHTRCGLSVNLECVSKTFCTRFADNAGRKNYATIASCAPSHNFVGLTYIFATKACIDNRKKIVKQQYLLHIILTIYHITLRRQMQASTASVSEK